MRVKPSSLYQDFILALDEEIDKIKEEGGGRKVFLENGELIKKSTTTSIYRFKSDNISDIPDDSPIEVVVTDNKAHGNIVTIEGNKITVALDTYLGEIVPEAWLEVSPYYLLEVLRDKYKKIDDNDHTYNIQLADKTFDFVTYKNGLADGIKFADSTLNDSQKSAVRFALGSEVSYIWGPPGTGKTTTLSEITSNFLNENKSILIASHTNIAIDNALHTIGNSLEKTNNEYLNFGKILRLGVHQLDNLNEKVTLDYWVEELSRKLVEKKLNVTEEIDKINLEIKDLNEVNQLSLRIQGLKERNNSYSSKVDEIDRQVNTAIQQERRLNQRIRELDKQLSQFEKLSQFRKRLNANKIRRTISDLERQNTALEDTKNNIQNLKINRNEQTKRLGDSLKKAEYLTHELSNYQDVIKKYVNVKEINRAFSNLNEELDKLKEKLSKINAKMESIEDSLIKEAKVVGTTLTKTYINDAIDSRKFDVIIVDEASTASIPLIYLALAHANDNAVIVGDFKQLSPISHTDNYYLSQSIFKDTGISDNPDLKTDKVVLLDTQHRMESEISALVNQLVYGGRLKDGENNNKKLQMDIVEINNQPVNFINTEDSHPYCTTTKSYSRLNIYSANIAATVAIQAADKKYKTLIITPYKAQAKLINNIIEGVSELGSIDYSNFISASTIHRAQGLESDLVIVDFVEGYGSKISRLLKGGHDSDTMRMLNVATTRAKSKIIFLGDKGFLEHNLKDFASEFLSNILDKAAITPSEKILNLADLHLSDEQEELKVYTEKNYYDSLLNDLSLSAKEVIIVSPFLSDKRIGFFEDTFKNLLLRGVAIKVVTDSNAENKLLERLKLLGIEVLQRRNIHEKFVYIDEKLAYIGSLNTLSQNTSKEIMMRYSSKKVISQIILGSNIYNYVTQKKKDGILSKYDVGHCKEKGCGAKMVVRESRYGIFASCSKYPVCKYSRNLDDEEYRKIFGSDFFKCSLGHPMEVRSTKRGRFVGCTMYPEHKETKSLVLPS